MPKQYTNRDIDKACLVAACFLLQRFIMARFIKPLSSVCLSQF